MRSSEPSERNLVENKKSPATVNKYTAVCRSLASRLRLRGAGYSPPKQTQRHPESATPCTIGVTRPSPASPMAVLLGSWRAPPRRRESAPGRARGGGRLWGRRRRRSSSPAIPRWRRWARGSRAASWTRRRERPRRPRFCASSPRWRAPARCRRAALARCSQGRPGQVGASGKHAPSCGLGILVVVSPSTVAGLRPRRPTAPGSARGRPARAGLKGPGPRRRSPAPARRSGAAGSKGRSSGPNGRARPPRRRYNPQGKAGSRPIGRAWPASPPRSASRPALTREWSASDRSDPHQLYAVPPGIRIGGFPPSLVSSRKESFVREVPVAGIL